MSTGNASRFSECLAKAFESVRLDTDSSSSRRSGAALEGFWSTLVTFPSFQWDKRKNLVLQFAFRFVVRKETNPKTMPSYASPHHRAYDRTLRLLSSSLTLVAIAEDDAFSDDSSTRVVRHNARLSRSSFGNQSFKTGLAELDAASRSCGSPPRSHSSADHGEWGFFVDE